ncbi:MAG: ankyrin repeat domain-containing protein [Planctomycetota bacterium]|jgi:ankyrin repeat protein
MTEFNEKEITRQFEHLYKIKPSEKATERAITRTRKTLARVPKIRKQQSTRFWKIAAAAVIVIGFAMVIYFGNGTIYITTPTFAQVINKWQQMKWIYGIKENRISGIIEEEGWASHELKLMRVRTAQGHAVVVDFDDRRLYQYNPLSTGAEGPEIEVSVLPEEIINSFRMFVQGPQLLMDAVINRGTEEGAVITMHKATYNGKDAIVYKFEIPMPKHGKQANEQSRWVVDAQTHLPIVNEKVTIANDGQRFSDIRMTFDYPDTAPKDIYELGAPRRAKIIDNTPKPSQEVARIAEIYYEHREKSFPRYTAVFNEGRQTRIIEYRDGPRLRVERYRLKNLRQLDKNPYFSQDQINNSFKVVFDWVKGNAVSECTNVALYDGLFTYIVEYPKQSIDDGRPPHRSRGREPHVNMHFLNTVWPPTEFDGDILEDDYSRKNGLICINRARFINSRAYLDPNRNYISIDKQAKYTQTESGHWYPQVIGETIIYLDDDPVFPEGTFDPNYLPNYTVPRDQDKGKSTLASDEVERYQGFTPLHMAVFAGNVARVKKLLTEGADPNPQLKNIPTPSELAAQKGYLEIEKLLKQHGGKLEVADTRKSEALCNAVRIGRISLVKRMIAKGANVNSTDKRGNTALYYAVCRPYQSGKDVQMEMVKLLLEHNANPDIPGNGGTPLQVLAQKSKMIHTERHRRQRAQALEVAKLLIASGANVNTPMSQGKSTLQWALTGGGGELFPQFIRLLVENGSDVNVRGMTGRNSPLFEAVSHNNLEIVTILLKTGADPFVDGGLSDGRLPLGYAEWSGNKEIEQLLRKYMEPLAKTRKQEIETVVRAFFAAIRAENYEKALQYVDVNSPESPHQGWEKWMESVHNWYVGPLKVLNDPNLKLKFDELADKYELLDDIVSIRFQSGFAEAIVRTPDQKKFNSLGLMRYPDNKWKVVTGWAARFDDLEGHLQQIPGDLFRLEMSVYRHKLLESRSQ